MAETLFIKEKKKIPNIVMVIIVAVVCSILGSLVTYFLLVNKINVANNNGTTNNVTTYQIEQTDSPVVAIAKKAGPSIVGVKVQAISQNIFGPLSESASEGSGIIYTEDGYIITNYHVISEAMNNSTAKVYVTLPNTDEEIPATIVGGDSTTDLAVIKIDKTGLTKAEIGKSSELEVGDLAVAIGNPLGQEFAGSVTVGYISALNRTISTDGRTYKLIQTDAAINPGNSGGALVNSQGQVIGINTVKISNSSSNTSVEGLGFATPIDDAIEVIDELIQNKKIVRPYIGINSIDIDSITAKLNNIPEGIYVYSVVTNSPAAKANIQKGDIIVGIEGKDIKTTEELNEVKNSKKVGDEITLKIFRNNQNIDVKVTLESDENIQQ